MNTTRLMQLIYHLFIALHRQMSTYVQAESESSFFLYPETKWFSYSFSCNLFLQLLILFYFKKLVVWEEHTEAWQKFLLSRRDYPEMAYSIKCTLFIELVYYILNFFTMCFLVFQN